MMDEVKAIFDAVGKMAKASILADKIAEKEKQIRSVTKKRCGNCDLWMKSTCKPEKERKQFKSMNSPGCKDFTIDPGSQGLEIKFKEELEQIQKDTT